MSACAQAEGDGSVAAEHANMRGGATDEAGREQRALLATIRHELRTPINGILGYSELLLEDEDEAGTELDRDLRRIHAAGAELLALVNDALDPARLEEAGQVDMEHFVAALHRDLRTPITTILGYSEMLIEDAASAGRDDCVPDLTKIRDAAARFYSLTDQVVSFSAGARQTDPASAGRPHPDGLAAADLVHDAVATIGVLHRDGRRGTGERGTLLIVDDNAINREVLTRQLERQGHSVTAVEHGRAALDAVHARAFDLILLDIMLPELNGYEVLRRLKADQATRDIPVIMISALDEIDSVVRCIELGAEDYLTKPFNPILLRARATACLEKKRLRDQEKEYLRHVSALTTAAAAVEAGQFDPASMAVTASRPDALGRLARVFERMAGEVVAREQRLRHEVQQLRIEIDTATKARQVSEITESDYFRHLQQAAQALRAGKQRAAVRVEEA